MILPGATLGVLGGGQLGRMFAIRAREMGYRVAVLDPEPGCPAAQVADVHVQGAYDDEAALARFAAQVAAVTTEFENVPADTLAWLRDHCVVRPPVEAVAVAQDRIREKGFLQANRLPTAPWAPVYDAHGLAAAWREVAAPAILKTSRLGYDGKGQVRVDRLEELPGAWSALGEVPCVLERRLALECELSVVLARGEDGAVAAFPAGENVHRDGILHTTTVPAPVAPALADAAGALAEAVAARLAYVGVLGVELFVAEGGRLFVNELAPRPHNSGHYTMDACAVDQFEQQVRALCGLPFGDPRLLSPVAMVNVLGDCWAGGEPRWDRALALPGVKLHLYGKAQPRPGRKMGHLTCVAPDPATALRTALAAHAALAGPGATTPAPLTEEVACS